MTQLELEKLVMLKYLTRVEEIMDANSDGKIGAVSHSYSSLTLMRAIGLEKEL